MRIRNAVISDIEDIMAIYKTAQDFMVRTGNPNQWSHYHPAKELIQADIVSGICKVIYDADGIHGVFALCEGNDPTYSYIEGGKWLNDEPYVTIHRIAGDQKVHGIFTCAMNHCLAYADNIRIDTHEDNKVMQSVLEKHGFKKCGIIYLLNGNPRIAYQRVPGDSYRFREITKADNKTMVSILRKNLEDAHLDIPGTVYFDKAIDRLSEMYSGKDCKYFVLTDGGNKVIGGIGYSSFAPMADTAELQKLYLSDEYKGSGLGYRMIQFIEEQMRKAGFRQSYLETHDNLAAAIHIYEKYGYTEIPRPNQVVHSTMNRFFIKSI